MTATDLRQTGISFFLGAGASMDMGFPSGTALKNRISGDLLQPRETELGRVMLRALPRERANIQTFGNDLGASKEVSIDAFLQAHREHLQIGRLAVWLCILEAERKALTRDITNHWLYQFLNRFLAGIPRADHLDRFEPNGRDLEFMHGLAIHTLNYDRLAEYTITRWIKDRFPKLDLAKHNFNPEGVVHHPHGRLGLLVGNEAVPFGASLPSDPRQILKLASYLRFWFEPSDADIMNRMIELRGVHVITGFGYHPSISARFRPPSSNDAKLKYVFATSSRGCRQCAEQWLGATYGPFGVHVKHLDGETRCSDLVAILFGEATGGLSKPVPTARRVLIP
jgi:hypothetical protein